MRPGRGWRRSAPVPTPMSMLSGLVNQVLALDPEHERILKDLDGRRLRLVVEGAPPMVMDLVVHGKRVLVEDGQGLPADVELQGAVSAMLSLLRSGGSAIPGGAGVVLRGDVQVLRGFQKASRELRPDWEEPLARVLGDRLATPVSRGLRGLAQVAAQTLAELKDTTSEYLREESELLVRRHELAEFADAVDTARERVDRLEKRLDALQRRHAAKA